MISKYSSFHLCLAILLCLQLSICQLVTDLSFIQNLKHKRLQYPIRFTYINRINAWWPPSSTLSQMGVPEYANPHNYNYIALTFWTCQKGPVDVSKVWDDPIKYFGLELGATKSQVQALLKKKYNDGGVSVMLSAFGTAQKPTTAGFDPVDCANKLGQFVKDNNFDGVDIDYEDNEAMNNGTGQDWLIKFMRQLRKDIPFHVVSHAPQGPYFASNYPGGGYRRIHKQVGNLIDFYNIQFYNQVKTTYDSYDLLFKNSGIYTPQTSISQLKMFGGVPYNMLVVGKPASTNDVQNTGYTTPSDLVQYFVKAKKQLGWTTGFMFWQYHSDQNGTLVNQLTQVLKSLNSN